MEISSIPCCCSVLPKCEQSGVWRPRLSQGLILQQQFDRHLSFAPSRYQSWQINSAKRSKCTLPALVVTPTKLPALECVFILLVISAAILINHGWAMPVEAYQSPLFQSFNGSVMLKPFLGPYCSHSPFILRIDWKCSWCSAWEGRCCTIWSWAGMIPARFCRIPASCIFLLKRMQLKSIMKWVWEGKKIASATVVWTTLKWVFLCRLLPRRECRVIHWVPS